MPTFPRGETGRTDANSERNEPMTATETVRKLRRQHKSDRDMIASLNRLAASQRDRILELLHSLDLAKTELWARRETLELVCQVLGRKEG